MSLPSHRLPAMPPLPTPAERWALYLDFDGTLAPIVRHPSHVSIEPGVTTLLERLSDRLQGAVCILSGRPLSQLTGLLGRVKGLCLVGSHGAESQPSGAPSPSPRYLQDARTEIERQVSGLENVWVECKPHGFAVHFRDHPAAGDEVRRLIARQLGATTGLRAMAGKCVAEVVAAGCDKGTALARLASTPMFRDRQPIAVGDDVTDEDAFAAAQSLGGFGVRVGDARPTAARYRLPCVALTRTWLEAVADRLALP